MKLITIILAAALFTIPVLASEVELSHSGDFVIITDQHERTYFIRQDKITSIQIRPLSEFSTITITTEELVVRHASGQVLEGGASAYKEYQFRLPAKDLAVEFVGRLITNDETAANKSAQAIP